MKYSLQCEHFCAFLIFQLKGVCGGQGSVWRVYHTERETDRHSQGPQAKGVFYCNLPVDMYEINLRDCVCCRVLKMFVTGIVLP